MQLHAHLHAPRRRDGDVLRHRLTSPAQCPEALLPLSCREPHCGEASLRCQNSFHVSLIFVQLVALEYVMYMLVTSFVGILFIDAVQRMMRVTAEADVARNNGQGMQDVRAESNFAARKF